MLKEIWYIVKDFIIKLLNGRLFAIGCIFAVMISILIVNLFKLQILNESDYREAYLQMTERVIKTPGTRGNIYDADGNLLAYNRLSYNLTISDNGAYTNDYNARNYMLYKLALILEKHEVNIVSRFEVKLDDSGEFVFTSSSDSGKKRFLAAVYGISTDLLDTEDRYSSSISAEEAFNIKVNDYRFNEIKDEDGHPVIPDEETMLDMVKILFTMRQTAFQRYETTTIAEDIDEECMAELLENQAELQGIDVEETYIRRYNNAKYFSHIIGYTGAVQDNNALEELQKTNPDYEITDIVGATGIEKSMETALQGTKGERHIYVDSLGQILETISDVPPKAGDDFYLTIPQNLQIGIYHLIEHQLAGILAERIVNVKEADIEETEFASQIVIPVDDAYFQLINNNVLDYTHFTAEDAGAAESLLGAAFTSHKEAVLSEIEKQLMSADASTMGELSDEYMAYMVFIYDYLASSEAGIIESSKIDQTSDSYAAWRDDTISLRDYLYSGISEGWINTTGLDTSDSLYADADDLFNEIVDFVMRHISDSTDFDKQIYKYMIIDRSQVTGRLLCMALFEQGVLEADDASYNALSAGDENYAYSFFMQKVINIEITPAQLALDPCMASVVVTDVNTGDVKALVTYPGYDNNRISDPDYFNKCLTDLSLPLINSATQTNKAPGSTFKPIAAAAVLEEKAATTEDLVDCTGLYDLVHPPIKCWLGIPGHGPLTVQQAISNSCNYCFAEYGHRLATAPDGTYSTTLGIEKIAKYAAMFGLDRLSGVQIDERAPQISDEDPERSAFGQSTHSFNNVQIARYATAVANTGKLFNLNLIDKETDADGVLKQDFTAEQIGTVELSDSTWSVLKQGMRDLITEGVGADVFRGFDTVNVAGKTGTAEEISTRGNHAWFISYAPYENPEIAVTVNIPFGYSSGNAASLAKSVYRYYYGDISLADILNTNASSIQTFNITD